MNFILDADFSKEEGNLERWVEKEWLVANGLGGFASYSVACIPTRKYHGFLTASLRDRGRTVVLNHLLETIILEDGREIILNQFEQPDGIIDLKGLSYLENFYLENGIPVWRYNFEGQILKKEFS